MNADTLAGYVLVIGSCAALLAFSVWVLWSEQRARRADRGES